MIQVVISSAWRQFHSSSPYLNLLDTKHWRCKITEVKSYEDFETVRAELPHAEALVCDDHTYYHFSKELQIPKLAIGGDLHAFTPKDAEQRVHMADWSTFVLSTCAFGKGHKTPYPYKWPPQSTFDKLVFFPHHVREEPVALFEGEKTRIGIGGELNSLVYPFRAMCSNFPEVTKIPYLKRTHGAFLDELAKYQIGITCNSIIGYNIAKYVEIPWAGSVLFAPRPCDAEMAFMGFDDSNSCLLPEHDCGDPSTVRSTLRELSHRPPDVLTTMGEAGRRLVGDRHTVWHRLEYIANLTDKIRQGGFHPDDALECFLRVPKVPSVPYAPAPSSDPSSSNSSA